MSDMTEWLKERRTIHDAATEGPWAVDGPAQAGPDDSLVVYPKDDAGAIAYVQPAWDDADSIVDAHNNLPALLTTVEKVLELHTETVHGECAICFECTYDGAYEADYSPLDYPCPTVRAVQFAIEGASNEQ